MLSYCTDEYMHHSASMSKVFLLTGIKWPWWPYSGFEISLFRSSETSKNDSRTSGCVRWTIAHFWFSHKLHWLYIFQTSEWYIRTSDFTIHLPDRQAHSIWNFEACILVLSYWDSISPTNPLADHLPTDTISRRPAFKWVSMTGINW